MEQCILSLLPTAVPCWCRLGYQWDIGAPPSTFLLHSPLVTDLACEELGLGPGVNPDCIVDL